MLTRKYRAAFSYISCAMGVRPLKTVCEGHSFNLRYFKLWSHRALRHRTTTCDGRSLCDRGPSFLVMFKSQAAMPELVEYRRATYLDVMRRRGCLYHICTCSHVHGLRTICCPMVVLRHRTRSLNHRTAVIVFRC